MIVLDGIPAEQLGIHVLKDYVDPSIPATRDSGVIIPGRHGEIDFGAYLGNREFSFPIVLIPQSSYQEALKNTENLKKILLDQFGRPRTFKLNIADNPERFYNVRYSGALSINDLLRNRFFTLTLVAHDPQSYALPSAYDPKNKQDYDKGLQYDSGIVYPNTQGFQWLYHIHYSGVFNHSHYVSPFKLIIKGRCKNPKITNLNTGAWVQITETFNNNDQLIIDAKTWTVVKNGTTNLLTKYKGDFIQLTEGENGFMFESETPPSAQVTFDWNHLFL